MMRKPSLYAMLFGIPGFFIALAAALAVTGAAAGLFWMVLFGDEPWPGAADDSLVLLFGYVFLLVWGTAIVAGYLTGRKLDPDSAVDRKHVLLSAGLTLAPFLIMLLHQWNVGNIGPKSDGMKCSEHCLKMGYPGSGMPPRNSGDRTCSCYDNVGKEALKIPIDSLDSLGSE